jgi:hypothetical protein
MLFLHSSYPSDVAKIARGHGPRAIISDSTDRSG